MNIPGYRIVRALCTRGPANVYLAEQEMLDRLDALKIFKPEICANNPAFLQERKATAQLRHPNIVSINDVDYANVRGCYVAMEHVAGGVLMDRIREIKQNLSVLQIIRQVALALSYAHSHGFIHGDIRPSNILFRDDGSAVVVVVHKSRLLQGAGVRV